VQGLRRRARVMSRKTAGGEKGGITQSPSLSRYATCWITTAALPMVERIRYFLFQEEERKAREGRISES
jgi:hypothetical protein